MDKIALIMNFLMNKHTKYTQKIVMLDHPSKKQYVEGNLINLSLRTLE